jgi:hypothetical protein
LIASGVAPQGVWWVMVPLAASSLAPEAVGSGPSSVVLVTTPSPQPLKFQSFLVLPARASGPCLYSESAWMPLWGQTEPEICPTHAMTSTASLLLPQNRFQNLLKVSGKGHRDTRGAFSGYLVSVCHELIHSDSHTGPQAH